MAGVEAERHQAVCSGVALAAQAAPRSISRASRHSTSSREIEVHDPRRRVGFGEADGEQFEHAVDGIGVEAGNLDVGDAVEMQRGALALPGAALVFPGEAVHQQGEAVVGAGKAHVADAHHGVLRGGGNHVEVFAVERQQFEVGHRNMSGIEDVAAQMGVGGTIYKHWGLRVHGRAELSHAPGRWGFALPRRKSGPRTECAGRLRDWD